MYLIHALEIAGQGGISRIRDGWRSRTLLVSRAVSYLRFQYMHLRLHRREAIFQHSELTVERCEVRIESLQAEQLPASRSHSWTE